MLVPEQCTYRSIVPSEYLSLNSIIYEIKDQEGKIRNTAIRDKENKFKNNSVPWMLRQLWKYPDQGVTQLKTFVHDTQHQNVNEILVRNINELQEEEALWYLRKLKEPQWVAASGQREMNIPIILETLDTEESFETTALIDSGCTLSSISKQFVQEKKINTIKLPRAITVVNADGTTNAGGKITEMVKIKMKINDHEEIFELAVTDIGRRDIFIGHDWLIYHNPEMEWQDNTIKFSRCPGECYQESQVNEPEDEIEIQEKEEGRLLAIEINEIEINRIQLRAKSNFATDIAGANQDERSWEEIVPKHYLPYREVFEKKTFNQLPPRRPWDHAIELIPGAKMVDCKIYPLNPSEQQQLDEFLKEQLDTGRIQPSKSPMA